MAREVIFEKTEGMRNPIFVWGDSDDNTIEQTKNVTRLPFIHKWVALAPDNHYGYGVPIGSIIPCDGYIMPYAVGSDIGCGMSAIPLGMHVDSVDREDIRKWFKSFEEDIPVGFSRHNPVDRSDLKRRDEQSALISDRFTVSDGYLDFMDSVKGSAQIHDSIFDQMGTLGGGNHFFELQKDQNGMMWLMVHSGSRNLGAKICDHHFNVALDMCTKFHSPLADKYLAYLPVDSREGQDYIEHMNIALDYAFRNREEMILAGLDALRYHTGWSFDRSKLINIHHNYAAIENHFGKNVWVHRKGATSARKGQVGIIPGSMCTKSFIVTGKGNKDSFMSCSHGSGRNFSRKESFRRIEAGLDAPVAEQLGDVMLFGAQDVGDEVGSSYKNVEDVMRHQEDLVDINYELTPLAVLKG